MCAGWYFPFVAAVYACFCGFCSVDRSSYCIFGGFLPYKRRNGKLQFREKEFPGGSAEILLKRFSEVKDVYRNPAAASKIKKSNLYLFTYGKLKSVAL
ncbi:glycerophosphodiester phosphodiesterase GDPD2-like [Daucus carota subsp. sativus]|uniref:glycerophosphodiester phosphodiesterase GDPD2-like n=1 Tax=Daucus carota subsp. sativus TaxID=79200 RepID=UPI00308295DB